MGLRKQKTVLDIFCGAGGFSAGFYMNGYKVIHGVDNWLPAMNTFNYNYNLKCTVKNVLDFEDDVTQIEELPDTDIILGSPPCVSFSNSNKSGKADKSLGIRLTETFLRIVAVKKYSDNSQLDAWVMENVVNSAKYLKDHYTFEDLNLTEWAQKKGLNSQEVVIRLKGNAQVLISSDYGCPQVRKRLITSENVRESTCIKPLITHKENGNQSGLKDWVTLKDVLDSLPSPNSSQSEKTIKDPIYSNVTTRLSQLTDHFYDSGLYQLHWEQSKYLKTNHPFMGKMSFPERRDRPSRTLTATNIGTSREAIIYSSEYERKGNGEFRIPTIREMACLMGFPITYQFLGKINAKQKLVGNAVCPSLSRAISNKLSKELGYSFPSQGFKYGQEKLNSITNLNTFSEKTFNNPPVRNKGARFRRHPFKYGNITVTLSNYRIDKSNQSKLWYTSIQYGNGHGFPNQNVPDRYYEIIENDLLGLENGRKFVDFINNGFSERIPDKETLQRLFEEGEEIGSYSSPIVLIETVKKYIDSLQFSESSNYCNSKKVFKYKDKIPIQQFFALYAINKISTISNNM